jgi:hypothetical protein
LRLAIHCTNAFQVRHDDRLALGQVPDELRRELGCLGLLCRDRGLPLTGCPSGGLDRAEQLGQLVEQRNVCGRPRSGLIATDRGPLVVREVEAFWLGVQHGE